MSTERREIYSARMALVMPAKRVEARGIEGEM